METHGFMGNTGSTGSLMGPVRVRVRVCVSRDGAGERHERVHRAAVDAGRCTSRQREQPSPYPGGDFFRNPARSNSTRRTMGADLGLSLGGDVSSRGAEDRGGGRVRSDTVSTRRSSVSDCTLLPSVTRVTCDTECGTGLRARQAPVCTQSVLQQHKKVAAPRQSCTYRQKLPVAHQHAAHGF